MDGQRATKETPFRDPRVRISGRRCALCSRESHVGLVLRFVGQLAGETFIGVECVIQASYDMAARRDAVIQIETLPGGGGGIILAQN